MTPSRLSTGTRAAARQRGHSLLDALLAFLVATIGVYGLVAAQSRIAHSADVAKQRTEATRLAQERIEALCSFTTVKTTAGHTAWADLAAGTDTVSSNAAYSRNWALGGSVDDAMRSVSVNLSWTDRAGQTQTVALASVISKTNPADVGALGFPLPGNTTLKRPMNRNLNIPVPAKDLGNGKSAYQFASNFAVIFNNDSGYVVQKCDKEIDSAEDLASGCELYEAFILAGYISRTMSSFPSTLNINTALLTGLDSSRSVSCTIADALDQNTGSALDGYKYYLCILPVNTGGTWSGTVRLTGMQSGTNYRVCRFQQAAAAGVTANLRNVQPYASVNESLDSQNYVITTANNCPTVSNLATTLHQNCSNSNSNRANDCPAS